MDPQQRQGDVELAQLRLERDDMRRRLSRFETRCEELYRRIHEARVENDALVEELELSQGELRSQSESSVGLLGLARRALGKVGDIERFLLAPAGENHHLRPLQEQQYRAIRRDLGELRQELRRIREELPPEVADHLSFNRAFFSPEDTAHARQSWQVSFERLEGNLLRNDDFSAWNRDAPRDWDVYAEARAFLVYDRVDVRQEERPGRQALRIRVLEPPRAGGAAVAETVLAQAVSHGSLPPTPQVDVWITARSPPGRLEVELAFADETQALTLEPYWQSFHRRFSLPDPAAAVSLTVGMPLERMLNTVEIASLALGRIPSPKPREEPTARARPAVPTWDGEGVERTGRRWVESNLLRNATFELDSDASAAGAPPGWQLSASAAAAERIDFRPDVRAPPAHGAAVLARRSTAVRLGLVPGLVRLEQVFDREQLRRLGDLAESGAGVAVEIFVAAGEQDAISLRVLLEAGSETLLATSRESLQPDAWQRLAAVESEPSALRRAGAEPGAIRLVLEIRGRGSLRLGPCWLGDARLPGGRAGDPDSDEWRYHRYLATVESRATKPAQPLEIHTLVFVDRTAASADIAAVERSVRSARETAARVRVWIVSDRDDGGRAVVDGSEAPDAEVFRSLDEAEQALAAELAGHRDGYLLVLEPGDVARRDLADYLGGFRRTPACDAYVFDHDTLDEVRGRCCPRFKPGLSAHLLLEHDYVERGVCYRIGALVGEEGAWSLPAPLTRAGNRDSLMQLLERGRAVVKVDQVLMHAAARDVDAAALRRQDDDFIAETLRRRGLPEARIEHRGAASRVLYPLPGDPLISIVIPFRDHVDLLRRAVESIRERSTYTSYEIVLVDHRSEDPDTLAYLETLAAAPNVRVVRFDRPFNYSAANNFGARQAEGEYLVFLNNDTEVTSAAWLEYLAGYAALPDTAFAGARLHFVDGSIQHAGIVVGHHDLAGHAFSGQPVDACPPELISHARDVSAVTAACCCIRADRFWELGGFDEEFILTGNDVELNLRALRRGYRNVVVPGAELVHVEKATRHATRIYDRDVALSLRAYEPWLSDGDPFWNRCLTRDRLEWTARALAETTPAEIRRRQVLGRERRMLERTRDQDAAFLARFDLSRRLVEENRALAEAFIEEPRPEIRRVAWFLPNLDHVFRGGVFTAFRFAVHLWRSHGVGSVFVICDHRGVDFEKLKVQCDAAFPGFPLELFHFDPQTQDPSRVPEADAGIATLWTTAYYLAYYNKCRAKFYLMQDYEPLFMTSGAAYGLVEQTYRLGYFGICNSPGVGEMYRYHGNRRLVVFRPAVDRDAFFPGENVGDDEARPLRIVFYGRPQRSRNAFGLGVQALVELKRIYGDDIEIVSVGSEFAPASYGIEGVVHNAGLLPDIESVARLYRSAHIGLVFMQSKHPSYQPLEYMASGCVCVSNLNEANTWLLRDRENCLLTPMTLTATVETLAEAIEEPRLRARIVKNALATVGELDWTHVEEQVAAFLLRLESSEP